MGEKKVVIVTGASRGIGRALAEKCSALGHAVAVCARDGAALKALDLKGSFVSRVLDVSKDDDVRKLAAEVLEKLGPPDLLINNAALMNTPAPLWRISQKDFDTLIDVNVKGVANMIRHFLPAMVERRSGVIVNLSSGWGRSTSPQVAPYCASKYAIEGLSKALAEELPKGMACIPLSPGTVDTDMLRSAWGEGAAESPTPDEWAKKAVPFILRLGARDNGRSLSISA